MDVSGGAIDESQAGKSPVAEGLNGGRPIFNIEVARNAACTGMHIGAVITGNARWWGSGPMRPGRFIGHIGAKQVLASFDCIRMIFVKTCEWTFGGDY